MFNHNEQNLAWLKNGADLQTETYCSNWFCSSHFSHQGYNGQFHYGLWFGAQDSVIPSHIQEALYRRVFVLGVCILFLWLRTRSPVSVCNASEKGFPGEIEEMCSTGRAKRERRYHRPCSALITREAANQWYFTCQEVLVLEQELSESLCLVCCRGCQAQHPLS